MRLIVARQLCVAAVCGLGWIVSVEASQKTPDEPAAEKKAEPAAVVIDDSFNGKTVKIAVGQKLVVRLKADRSQTGWDTATGIIGDKNKAPVGFVSRGFEPDPKANDPTIGVAIFRYQGVKEGNHELGMAFNYPGGPAPMARLATQFIRGFRVTIQVTKAE